MAIRLKAIEECRLELIAATQGVPPLPCHMDNMPVHAARVSFGKEEDVRSESEDARLMNYLAQHDHLTPFEYQHATFMIECPLFIRSQIHRHRTFSFNEISRRYTSDEIEFWKPTTWRGQAEKNKQGSEGEIRPLIAESLFKSHEAHCQIAVNAYETALNAGVAREQARAILPQSLLTRFYMGGNLRNWVHFLKLRLDEHAQYEVRVIAQRIHKQLAILWPNSLEALMK
ncbi:MAG TPA: FAD-dependent thymidylate synthase [Candidatus Acidoferrales bacterium]|nr:FAD-dependent thymidylate synthase [Candidatus Acidoferrales bacterium]